MDTLDSLLLEAWNRIGDKCRRDRWQALRRSRRRFRRILRRPLREWCLVIRASDTRIDQSNALVEFDAERLRPPPSNHVSDPAAWALKRGIEHTLRIPGRVIRQINKPVVIEWPGVPREQAARMCGRTLPTIEAWIQRGVFQIDHYREFRFPGAMGVGGKRYSKLMCARQRECMEKGRPHLWTPAPIDANSVHGRVPHAVWGTLWQHLGEEIPDDFEVVVRRVPRMVMYRGKRLMRNWAFICPGRLDERGREKGCGRLCTRLYGPQTVWTWPQAIGADDGFDMPPQKVQPGQLKLTGQWFPGSTDASSATGPRTFACQNCWGCVGTICTSNHRGWNEFITHISGGLLYGRDVKRPLDICPLQRRRREYRFKPRLRPSEAVAAAQRSA